MYKKNHLFPWGGPIRYVLTMKLSFLLIAFFCLQAEARVLAQRATITVKEASLKTVFKILKKETGYDFLYKSAELDQTHPVTLNFKEQPLTTILDACVQGQSLNYQIDGGTVLIHSIKTKTPIPTLPAIRQLAIKGRIVDPQNQPLAGVSITVKTEASVNINGTTSDADGNFSLQVSPNAILTVSYVGYQRQEVLVENQSTLTITLVPDEAVLDEVVVVGYGTMSKKDLTGAVATLQGDLITNRKTTQVSQALQGAVPGLMVTRNNNAPGATANIRVRGVTTITDGGANPLYILDGVPIDDINSVNPNDIDNISVLKDAASASIYGSRAASGVILITTKRAKEGQVGLDYSVEYGWERATRYPEYVDAVRFMQLTNELRWNDNANNENQYPIYAQDRVDNYLELNQQNPDEYPIADWRALTLNKYAPRQSHILGIYGANNFVKTRASIVYDKSLAFYDDRSYQRVTARMNNDFVISDYLSASIDLNYRRTIIKQPVTLPMYHLGIMPPIYAPLWSDGRIGAGKDGANIYALTTQGGFDHDWFNQIGARANVDFKPFDGFKLTGVFAPFLNFDKGKLFNRRLPYTPYSNPNVIGGYIEGAIETRLQEDRNDNHRYTVQFLANYDKKFGEHHLSALAGYEYFYAFNEDLGASRGQYQVSGYPYLNVGPLEFRNNSGSAFENAYRSWFGRIGYHYKDRYLFQGNIRYDGSSRFAPAYRWGSFPSFSVGWVVSEESFLKNRSNSLSFLKIRASYGNLGNERIGNYPYQRILNFENNSLFYRGNTAVSSQSAAQWQYAIRDISWETTSSWNIGLDANFFSNRLTFVGDAYRKTTRDMLLELQIPEYIGFDNPNQNTGEMYTKGWELQVGWNDRIGSDFRYSASFNISDFRSIMGDLGGTQFIGNQIRIQGSEFDEWYGYVSDGLFQTQEEVSNSPVLNANVRPGDIRYLDISGPDGVPDGRITPEYDRVLLGGSLPRYMYGANFNFGYKNWDFSFVIQGVGKQNVRLHPDIVQPLRENYGNFPAILDGNTWSHYNTPEQNLNAQYPRYSNTSAGNNYALSDFWLINGGYFRLKNISLGYQLPKLLMDRLHMKGMRIYAAANDVWAIHNLPRGWDPEMNTLGYPITTTLLIGASVNF